MQAATSAGLTLRSNNGTTGLTVGAGGGANVTTADGLIVSGLLQANAGLTVTGTTTIGGATLSLAGNTSVSTFGASLIDDATNADARNTLGLGTIATQSAASVAITGGAINGTSVGATTRSTGAFTTLVASSGATFATSLQYSTTTFDIIANSPDGTDNRRVRISGGGSADPNRGASLQIYGNEYPSLGGQMIFDSGEAGQIFFRYGAASTTAINVTTTGATIISGTDPGSVAAGRVALGGGVVRAAGNIFVGGTADVSGQATFRQEFFSTRSQNDTSERYHIDMRRGSGVGTTASIRTVGDGANGVSNVRFYLSSEVCRLTSTAINLATGVALQINGTQVVGPRGSAIANPSGGATVDAEARIVLSNILSALRTHGLIAT
jgi:hypothetical protein